MPQVRSYPEATLLLTTDAFVLDRIGQGTMFIEAQNMATGFRVIQTNDTNMTSGVAPSPPLDHVIWDNAGGFAVATPPGIYASLGDVPIYTFPTTGPWFVHGKVYMDLRAGGSQTVQCQTDILWLTADGNTQLADYNTAMTQATMDSAIDSNQFSLEVSGIIMATAGQFILFSVNDQTAGAWHNLTIKGSDSTLFPNTFLEGWALH